MTLTAKRLCALSLAACLLAGSAAAWRLRADRTPAADTPDDPAAAGSLVTDDPEWDFGAVRQESEPLTHSFSLTNRGPTPIDLELGTVGCGCMSVHCPERVPPGSRAAVEVTIDPRQKRGPFSGPAEIRTSDPTTPVVWLKVRADAVPTFTLDPEALAFFDVQPGDLPERELFLITRLEPGAAPSATPRSESSSASVRCEHKESDVSEGRPDRPRRITHRFVVRLDAKAWLAEGRADSTPAHIHFSVPGGPADVQIPVRVTRRHHPVVVGPTTVVLHRSRPTDRASVRLWARDGRELKVAEMKPSKPQISVEVVASPSPKFSEIQVALAETKVTNPDADRASIEVSFAGDQMPTYRIDVLILP